MTYRSNSPSTAKRNGVMYFDNETYVIIATGDANSTSTESCCSRCPLALAGVLRAGRAVSRGTGVVNCRPMKRAKNKSEAGEAAAGDLVY